MASLAAAKKARPLGQVTRGKTARQRQRQTDTFLALAYPETLRRMPGLYVDLGYGAFPVTTLETRQRLGRLNPALLRRAFLCLGPRWPEVS